MKLNESIMKEANCLLEYSAPEMKELNIDLVCGMNIGGEPTSITSGDEVFGADGGGEENGVFSLLDE